MKTGGRCLLGLTMLGLGMFFAGCGQGAGEENAAENLQREQAALVQADGQGADSGLFFLPPLAPPVDKPGTFAADLNPAVFIQALDGAGRPGRTVATFRRDDGGVRVGDDQYRVDWQTRDAGLVEGWHRINVRLGDRVLGHIDILLARNASQGRDAERGRHMVAVLGRNVGIKFWLNACAPVVCRAQDSCHEAGRCDPFTAVCSNPVKEDGASCSDEDACTQTDLCWAGVCRGVNPVSCVTPQFCRVASVCAPTTGVCSAPLACNEAPVIQSLEAAGQVVAGVPLAIDATVSDDGLPAGSTLSFAWSLLEGPGPVHLADPGVPDAEAVFSLPGLHRLRLVVSDSERSASAELEVTVLPPNQAPVVNAGPDQAGRTEDAIGLSGQVTDDGWPRGQLSSTWMVVSGPGLVVFADARQASTTATFSVAGSYRLRLTASDSALEASDEMVVQVASRNAPPVVSVKVGSAVALPSRGRVVVSSDEWTLCDMGFAHAPTTANFVRNLARFFSPGRPGKFLVHSVNFGLREYQFQRTLIEAGHSVVFDHTAPFDVVSLRQYDAVFLAGEVRPNDVLIQYVEAGGGVYLAVGTGGGGVTESANWRQFLTHFGLNLSPEYVALSSQLDAPDASSANHLLFQGVTGLFFSGAVPVIEVVPSDPWTVLMTAREGDRILGRIGIFEAAPATMRVLDGEVSDDRVGGGTLTSAWQKVSGPGSVFFSPVNGSYTGNDVVVRVSVPGTYVFRLVANDSTQTSFADLTVTF